jgi:hypothetical protein
MAYEIVVEPIAVEPLSSRGLINSQSSTPSKVEFVGENYEASLSGVPVQDFFVAADPTTAAMILAASRPDLSLLPFATVQLVRLSEIIAEEELARSLS